VVVFNASTSVLRKRCATRIADDAEGAARGRANRGPFAGVACGRADRGPFAGVACGRADPSTKPGSERCPQ
jgi:hypothetical protein